MLPPGIAERLGLVEGATVRVEEREDTITIGRSTAGLARVYVEPTNLCNLRCRTCVRNVWDEPWGSMSSATFSRVMDGVRRISPVPAVFFGGFGEPFAHPDILAMVAEAKGAGSTVELITNGTALDEGVSRELIRIGLDRLWVSIDGASPESYADVRLRDALPQIIDNLRRLRHLRTAKASARPSLGIAFVAMKQNITDLPEVIRLGTRLGADRFSVTNVLPHTPEMRDQVLYADALCSSWAGPSAWVPEVSLPRMDIDELTAGRLARVRSGRAGAAGAAWASGRMETPARSWRRRACRSAGMAR